MSHRLLNANVNLFVNEEAELALINKMESDEWYTPAISSFMRNAVMRKTEREAKNMTYDAFHVCVFDHYEREPNKRELLNYGVLLNFLSDALGMPKGEIVRKVAGAHLKGVERANADSMVDRD